jgi:hypothetical protein
LSVNEEGWRAVDTHLAGGRDVITNDILITAFGQTFIEPVQVEIGRGRGSSKSRNG